MRPLLLFLLLLAGCHKPVEKPRPVGSSYYQQNPLMDLTLVATTPEGCTIYEGALGNATTVVICRVYGGYNAAIR